MLNSLIAANEPAGGAAIGEALGATLGATLVLGLLLFLITRYRRTGRGPLAKAASFSSRLSGLPEWASLPSGVATVSLLTAVIGMYWDISLHIDAGRDAGPLANPAHYLILVGLFGIFSAGLLAIALPRDGERPGPAPVRVGRDWYAPIGGVLMAGCGAFSLLGFPLDDVWHRMFGQDVTLWGPTHLMLIGGAGFSLIAQAVLLAEARPKRSERKQEPTSRFHAIVVTARRVGVMGGLLIGLSTFQGEFDFGVPQFQMVFQPMLIAVAAAIALVAGRLWIGPGGALGVAAFFIAVRGGLALIVGPVLGETTPLFPLYLGEALCVELIALVLLRRPLAFGAVAGLAAGTVGLASEWPWVDAVFKIGWTEQLLPEAVLLAAAAGTAGGVIGALLTLGLRGRLPRPAVARPAMVGAIGVIAFCVAFGLAERAPNNVRADVTLAGGQATIKLDPPDAADKVHWFSVTSWQAGKLRVDHVERVGAGVYRTNDPIPVTGEWKSILRLHRDREVLGVPIYMPADTAIPAPEVPASPRFTRTFVDDQEILQRERKDDAPGWLWLFACLVVLSVYLSMVAALAWGIGRIGSRGSGGEPPARREPAVSARPTPAGA